MITQHAEMFSLMLRPCTSAILAHAVDASVPHVWIRRHQPNRYLQWWRAQVPLSSASAIHDVEVRSLEFDLHLPATRFLQLLPEFQDHGMAFFQMSRPVPDTLSLDRIPEDAIDRVLIQNGLHLAYYLPHALETAQFRSPRREVLEQLLQAPEIRALAYEEA